MEDRVKKSLWIITVIAALLIPIICFNVTVGRAENVRFIIPEALKELIEKRDANFLIADTQPKAAYKLGHIKGAINFPWAREIKSPADLPRDKVLILYCDCANEEDSTGLAKQLLRNWEYVYVRVLKGGWAPWRSVGARILWAQYLAARGQYSPRPDNTLHSFNP
jgi:3-mercaptopyruvate sulfurtransferase SseA